MLVIFFLSVQIDLRSCRKSSYLMVNFHASLFDKTDWQVIELIPFAERLCSASYRDLWRHTYFSGLDIDHLQFSEQLADMPVIDEIRATSRMTMENSQASISFEELIVNAARLLCKLRISYNIILILLSHIWNRAQWH